MILYFQSMKWKRCLLENDLSRNACDVFPFDFDVIRFCFCLQNQDKMALQMSASLLVSGNVIEKKLIGSCVRDLLGKSWTLLDQYLQFTSLTCSAVINTFWQL